MPTKLRRREFLRGVGAAAALGTSVIRRSIAAAPDRRPNVLFIVADDQRSDTIGALGNQHIQTPHLDRVVKNGFAFTRARCMGAQNPAVCVPCRAMIMSGRTLFRAPENLPPDVPIMPQVFQQAGYTSFGGGKWHNTVAAYARGFNTGGNIFFGGMHDQFKMPVYDFNPAGKYPQTAIRVPGKFSSELFTDAAVEFLGRLEGGKPFFCYLAYTSPHDPRTPPPPFSTMYDAAKMPLPANFLPSHPFDNGEMIVRDEMLAPFPRTPDDTRQQLCDYYGMITSQDAQVGRLLDTLAKTGLAENTIVVYTGDHGLAIGSHGLFGKQNVYEHSAGVPLIFSGPGIPSGKTSDALVYGFDIFPTLCEMLGIGVPDKVEGKSLKRIIDGRDAAMRASAFHAYVKRDGANVPPATQLAVNDGRWKYMKCRVKKKVTVRLFDMQADLNEMYDLSQDPAAAKERGRMDAILEQSKKNLGAPADVL
jgi:arylsulfatase A-like enzyme